MRRFFTLSHSLLLINLRDPSTLFWSFAFPIGLISLYGAIWGHEQVGPVQAITWLMVGIIVLNIMSGGFMGDSAWLTVVREQGILLRVRTTPLPSGVLVSAYVVVRLVLVIIQSILIAAVAMLFFGAQLVWSGLAIAFVIALLGAVVFIALGQAIGTMSPTSGAAAAMGQAVYFPLMFVSNLFLPSDILPSWITEIARWTPAYMLVDLLRPALVPVVEASQSVWINLLGLLMYGVIGLVIAALFFRWIPRR
ncbi:MAG: ABC transporter permease [Chloroflexota bacterium]